FGVALELLRELPRARVLRAFQLPVDVEVRAARVGIVDPVGADAVPRLEADLERGDRPGLRAGDDRRRAAADLLDLARLVGHRDLGLVRLALVIAGGPGPELCLWTAWRIHL